MVSVLAFDSVDLSSNATEVYKFYVKIVVDKDEKINRRRD